VYLLSLQAQKYIMQIRILLAITLLTLALGCGSTKNSTASQDVVLDQIDVIGKKMPYRASATRKHDLLHTKLSVKFDWENQHLHGEAWLDLKPYFYTTNVLELDAKGMDIKEVALTRKDNV
jgi:aminopeptidase N